MKAAFFLAAGLLAATPVMATPGWDEPQTSALPQSELSYGAITPPSAEQRRQALAAARLPAPNDRAANVVPNGPATANPPGAGASNSATLQEHGEVAAGTPPARR